MGFQDNVVTPNISAFVVSGFEDEDIRSKWLTSLLDEFKSAQNDTQRDLFAIIDDREQRKKNSIVVTSAHSGESNNLSKHQTLDYLTPYWSIFKRSNGTPSEPLPEDITNLIEILDTNKQFYYIHIEPLDTSEKLMKKVGFKLYGIHLTKSEKRVLLKKKSSYVVREMLFNSAAIMDF